MPRTLRANDCYIGQRVFWVMWCDAKDTSENRIGYYAYRNGFSPEVWSSCVERLPGNGSIMLKGYGRAKFICSCEMDAIQLEYELFCSLYLTKHFRLPKPTLGEASRVLRELAELEFGLHCFSNGVANGR